MTNFANYCETTHIPTGKFISNCSYELKTFRRSAQVMYSPSSHCHPAVFRCTTYSSRRWLSPSTEECTMYVCCQQANMQWVQSQLCILKNIFNGLYTHANKRAWIPANVNKISLLVTGELCKMPEIFGQGRVTVLFLGSSITSSLNTRTGFVCLLHRHAASNK